MSSKFTFPKSDTSIQINKFQSKPFENTQLLFIKVVEKIPEIDDAPQNNDFLKSADLSKASITRILNNFLNTSKLKCFVLLEYEVNFGEYLAISSNIRFNNVDFTYLSSANTK